MNLQNIRFIYIDKNLQNLTETKKKLETERTHTKEKIEHADGYIKSL